MKQGLALFDFDGTITSRDTLFEIIKYHRGIYFFLIGLVWLSPILTLHLFKFVSAQVAKEAVLSHFLKAMPIDEFKKMCFLFSQDKLPGLLNTKAIQKIEWHKQAGHRVVVVTASPENWVQDWCNTMSIDLIGTKLEVIDERITGRLSSPNCNGLEKVKRIKKYLNIDKYEPIYAYGNSKGDADMLKLATHAFYRSF